MKNLVPIVIVLLATFFFIVELAKESAWEVKTEKPMYNEIDIPETTVEEKEKEVLLFRNGIALDDV